MSDQSDLQGYINSMKEYETALYNLASDIHDKFDWLLGKGIDLGPEWLNTIVFGYEPPGDRSWVEGQRDRAKEVVNNVVYGLEGKKTPFLANFYVGMDLPVDLITIAGTWLSIKDDVTLAQASERATYSLGNTWKGDGATAYEMMRMKEQDFAFTAMINVAETTASELEKIAKEVSKYYMELQKQIVTLVTTVKDFYFKILSTEFVKTFVDTIAEICKTIVDTLGTIVNTLTTTTISQNRLDHITKSQVGFNASNQWPQPNISVFSDFSKTDGDGSDWDVK